jgi:hypothetical protein
MGNMCIITLEGEKMNIPVRHTMRLGILLVLTIGAAVPGCAFMGPQKRVATPAELEQFGSRTYPGYDSKAVQLAAVTALKVQGYEIVTEEPRIRTSPKLALLCHLTRVVEDLRA